MRMLAFLHECLLVLLLAAFGFAQLWFGFLG